MSSAGIGCSKKNKQYEINKLSQILVFTDQENNANTIIKMICVYVYKPKNINFYLRSKHDLKKVRGNFKVCFDDVRPVLFAAVILIIFQIYKLLRKLKIFGQLFFYKCQNDDKQVKTDRKNHILHISFQLLNKTGQVCFQSRLPDYLQIVHGFES